MALHFTLRATDPAIICLDGDLTLGPQLSDFGRQASQLLATRRLSGLLLQMAGIDQIDSAGLGELVILFTTATQQGTQFCVTEPTPRLIRLLETTKLSGLFPLFADTAAAQRWIAETAER